MWTSSARRSAEPACSTEATFSAARRSSVVRLAAIRALQRPGLGRAGGLGGLVHGAHAVGTAALDLGEPQVGGLVDAGAARLELGDALLDAGVDLTEAAGVLLERARLALAPQLERLHLVRAHVLECTGLVGGGALELEQPLLRDVEHAAARGLELGHPLLGLVLQLAQALGEPFELARLRCPRRLDREVELAAARRRPTPRTPVCWLRAHLKYRPFMSGRLPSSPASRQPTRAS